MIAAATAKFQKNIANYFFLRIIIINKQYGDNLIGKYISENSGDPIRILDVGSGQSMTFKNIASGNNASHFEYTSIDNAFDNTDHLFQGDEWYTVKRLHIHADILLDTIELSTRFETIIIDVEPHAHEIEIYEKVYDNLADDHFIILKCIGRMDMYGTSLADKFIDYLINKNVLVDHFAIYEGDYFIRDVLVVVSKIKNGFSGNICNYIRSHGGHCEKYFIGDLDFQSHVCNPSKFIIDSLVSPSEIYKC